MNWGRCELGSPGFRDPHVFFEAKAKKKKARTVWLGSSFRRRRTLPTTMRACCFRRVGAMNCFPCVFLAIVCVRDPHVFCGEKDSTNTTSKSLTREQHKRRFVCIIQWMGLNLSKSRQQGLSVAYSTPPQIQLVWKGSESIHIRIIIEYALSRSYRLTRNAYQPRSLPLAMDSNLEAFSYYPTDGSFAPSAFQPSALPII